MRILTGVWLSRTMTIYLRLFKKGGVLSVGDEPLLAASLLFGNDEFDSAIALTAGR